MTPIDRRFSLLCSPFPHQNPLKTDSLAICPIRAYRLAPAIFRGQIQLPLAPKIAAATAKQRGAVMSWYCVYTKPRMEFITAQQLVQQHFGILLLTYIKTFPRNRAPVERPLFSRYLFAEFDIKRDPWRAIKSTYGVHRLFMSVDEIPIPIPDAVITLMRKLHVDNEPEDPRAKDKPKPIPPGTKVRIIKGRFAGSVNDEAICSWSDLERVKLLLAIMGREIEFEFYRDEVELVKE